MACEPYQGSDLCARHWEADSESWNLQEVPSSSPLKIFIWPHWVLVAVCGVFSCCTWDLVPRPGVVPGPLHWEDGVSATGPPGKFLCDVFLRQNFFFFWKPQSLFIRSSTDWMKPIIHSMRRWWWRGQPVLHRIYGFKSSDQISH